MKLLIDIPEKIVTAIQNGEDYRYDIHTAIAQGIPYEPKGDLISRDALKRTACVKFYTTPYYKHILDLIDNAPTVDAYPFEQVQELVKLNQQFAQEIENLKRPQGKKIKKKPYGWVYCSECDSLLEPQDKFCWNCGADMKGGTE